jgi:hypothetical protein
MSVFSVALAAENGDKHKSYPDHAGHDLLGHGDQRPGNGSRFGPVSAHGRRRARGPGEGLIAEGTVESTMDDE